MATSNASFTTSFLVLAVIILFHVDYLEGEILVSLGILVAFCYLRIRINQVRATWIRVFNSLK